MKKVRNCFVTVVFILLMMTVAKVNVMAAEVIDSKTEGDIDWTLYKDGLLDIKKTENPNGKKVSYRNYSSKIKSVNIYPGVTAIDSFAFSNCEDLSSITIPDSITSIGFYAFSSCTSLSNITIPNSVTSIGMEAFIRCTSLSSITIPDSVTSIGNRAFGYCTSLKGITISDSVTSIGMGVFESCTSLSSITIPGSVTSIGDYAFSRCTSLSSITIPDSVTSIEMEAFESCTSLRGITISDSVTSIGDYAFSRCTSLSSITIPDSVTVISSCVFRDCTNLNSITISGSVTEIETGLFINCTNLRSISLPDSVTTIKGNVFNGCTRLTSITIPKSVTRIEKDAFKGCNAEIYYLGSRELWNKIKCNDNSLPKTFDVTDERYFQFEISGKNMFINRYLGKDVNVNIPQIVYVQGSAYNVCLDGAVFEGNTKVETVSIDDKVLVIDSTSMFDNCNSLKSVELPNSITAIGDYMFNCCEKLETLSIPDSIGSIGNYAFYNCSKVNIEQFPSGIISIGNVAFYNCHALKSLDLPDGLITIGKQAFYNCDGITSIKYVGNDLSKIGEKAFYASRKITTSVASINDALLSYDWGGSNREINHLVSKWLEKYKYSVDETNKIITLTKYISNDANANIEKTAYYNYSPYKVYLDNTVFTDNVDIKKVVISSGVKINDADELFSGCTALEHVSLPWVSELIGNKMFYNCQNLISLDGIAYVTSIGAEAFLGCSNLTISKFPSSLKRIGDKAFYECTSLRTINYTGSSLTKIGKNAFYVSDDIELKLVTDNYSLSSYDWEKDNRNLVFTVTFFTSKNEKLSSNNVKANSKMEVPNIQMKPGYSICSWYYVTSSGWKKNWDFENDIVSGDIKLYGEAIPNEYYVSFDSNGGEVINDKVKVTYSCKYGKLPVPKARNGYTFLGWFAKADSEKNITSDSIVTIAGDHTLFARWKEADHGICGENIEWRTATHGNSTTLFIEGFGEMYDYGPYDKSPWSNISFDEIHFDSEITKIGDWAFANSESLQEVYLPTNLQTIGNHAFYECPALNNIHIYYGLTSIGEFAFCRCGKLETIDFPTTLLAIPASCFSGCVGLKYITIPENVFFVGKNAFYYCENLEWIIIPNKVRTIEKFAFYECSKLKDVYYLGTSNNWNKIDIDYSGSSILKRANIHYSIISVEAIKIKERNIVLEENRAVQLSVSIMPNDASVKSVIWSSTDDSVCIVSETGLVTAKKAGSAVIRAESEDGNCYDECCITVNQKTSETDDDPKNDTIDTNGSENANYGISDSSNARVAVGKELTDGRGMSTGYVVTRSDSSNLSVEYVGTARDKNKKSIVIPKTVKDTNGNVYTVISIKAGAFKGFKKLSKVKIPNTVAGIGNNAFKGCKNIKNITINVNPNLKIGSGAFKKINKHAVIVVKGVKGKQKEKIIRTIKKQTNAKVK